MKHLLITLFLLIAYNTNAAVVSSSSRGSSGATGRTIASRQINSATTNIPAAFSTSNSGSLAISTSAHASGFCVMNYAQEILGVNYSNASTSVTPTVTEAWVPNASSGSFTSVCLDNSWPSETIYLRSAAASGVAISSGNVFVWTY